MHTNAYYKILNVSIGTVYLINGTEGVESVVEYYQRIFGGL